MMMHFDKSTLLLKARGQWTGHWTHNTITEHRTALFSLIVGCICWIICLCSLPAATTTTTTTNSKLLFAMRALRVPTNIKNCHQIGSGKNEVYHLCKCATNSKIIVICACVCVCVCMCMFVLDKSVKCNRTQWAMICIHWSVLNHEWMWLHSSKDQLCVCVNVNNRFLRSASSDQFDSWTIWL